MVVLTKKLTKFAKHHTIEALYFITALSLILLMFVGIGGLAGTSTNYIFQTDLNFIHSILYTLLGRIVSVYVFWVSIYKIHKEGL